MLVQEPFQRLRVPIDERAFRALPDFARRMSSFSSTEVLERSIRNVVWKREFAVFHLPHPLVKIR